jgi:uncharacterized phage-associated protein
MVERQLDEMKRDRDAPGFLYRRRDLLYPGEHLKGQIDGFALAIERVVRDEIHKHFGTALRGLLAGRGRWTTPENATVKTSRTIEEGIEEIRKDFVAFTTQQRAVLTEFLRKPVSALIHLYDDERTEQTVLGRQASLLDQMKSWMPERCKKLTQEILDAKSTGNKYSSEQAAKFQALINKRTEELKETTFRHLEECVYLPTKECFEFLFADDTALAKPEIAVSSFAERMSNEFEISSVLKEIGDEVDSTSKKALSDLKEAENKWLQEWQALNRDFRKLAEHATIDASTLRQRLLDLDSLLEISKADCFGTVFNLLQALRGRLATTVKQNSDLIDRALKDSERSGLRKNIVEMGGVVTGLLLSIVSFWKANLLAAWSQRSGKTALFLGTATVGLALFAWMFRRLLLHRATFDTVFRTNYEVRTDEFIDELKDEISEAKQKIEDEVAKQNAQVSASLQRLYDNIVEGCEKAKKEVLPPLGEQIKVAAKLGENTTASVTLTRDRALDKIDSAINAHLNKICERMDTDVRQSFSRLASDLGEYYAGKLEEYTRLYKGIAKELMVLRAGLTMTLSDLNSHSEK